MSQAGSRAASPKSQYNSGGRAAAARPRRMVRIHVPSIPMRPATTDHWIMLAAANLTRGSRGVKRRGTGRPGAPRQGDPRSDVLVRPPTTGHIYEQAADVLVTSIFYELNKLQLTKMLGENLGVAETRVQAMTSKRNSRVLFAGK